MLESACGYKYPAADGLHNSKSNASGKFQITHCAYAQAVFPRACEAKVITTGAANFMAPRTTANSIFTRVPDSHFAFAADLGPKLLTRPPCDCITDPADHDADTAMTVASYEDVDNSSPAKPGGLQATARITKQANGSLAYHATYPHSTIVKCFVLN
eukprot:gnl/MRDRNA2_/MRDRNA2_86182_c0_seq3.p1 gnl/MRDRNA2_/MRDRNA2_86182_c0~~gnl/MRDRNA2_/MRDRNA2_86182_c0_seq3.p1  ORF type:complete len:157 (-),score=10.49 gnl/MRDRNA2_/MRDRNA2_86182_c0_seq3:138-608(-)